MAQNIYDALLTQYVKSNQQSKRVFAETNQKKKAYISDEALHDIMNTVKVSKRQLRETIMRDDLNQESIDSNSPHTTADSKRKNPVDLSKIVVKSVSPSPYMNKTSTNFLAYKSIEQQKRSFLNRTLLQKQPLPLEPLHEKIVLGYYNAQVKDPTFSMKKRLNIPNKQR